MSEPQLERSVLEAKEREELFAIANALGTKPTSRARKSELVSQILQATGVEVVAAAPGDRQRRTRTRDAAQAAEAGAAPAAPASGATGDIGSASVATGDIGSASGATGDVGFAAGLPGSGGTARAEEDAAEERSDGGACLEPAGSATTDADDPPGRRSQGGARRAPARDSDGGARRGPAGDGAGADRREAGPGARRGADQEGAASNGHAPAPSASDVGAPGPGTPEAGASGEERNAGRYDGDQANRRSSRRRRGRDRSERDLVGQSAEQQFNGEPTPVAGLLDLRDEGYGFLRADGYLPGPNDVYVSIGQVRRFALRRGDHLEGGARPAGGNEKYPALVRVDRVSGLTSEEARSRPRFEQLTPLFPDQRLKVEIPGDSANSTTRIIELISPIGKGQRGLVVSPPKAGKTTILKHLAHAIEVNNPDVHLMVLLVDERPEEVTDMRRSVKGEVVASTFDRPSEEHTQVAELAIERAKRMVEVGRDVVVVLDGITRLARAYNLAQPPTGRIMSGGIDTGALYPPKKFFGAARNIEEGGSLTILATALVETGSKMDEVIFEEFKGTGNMELRLDRRLAERRIFPALDVNASSTRHEELLFDRDQLQQVWKLRRALNALAGDGNHAAGLELLLDRLKATRNNEEFLADIAKNPTPGI